MIHKIAKKCLVGGSRRTTGFDPLVIVISNNPKDLLDPSDDVEWHQPNFPPPHAVAAATVD